MIGKRTFKDSITERRIYWEAIEIGMTHLQAYEFTNKLLIAMGLKPSKKINYKND